MVNDVKSVEKSNFFLQMPIIWRRFWPQLLFFTACLIMMIITSSSLMMPSGYRVNNVEVYVPMGILTVSHLLYPFALNPWFCAFHSSDTAPLFNHKTESCMRQVMFEALTWQSEIDILVIVSNYMSTHRAEIYTGKLLLSIEIVDNMYEINSLDSTRTFIRTAQKKREHGTHWRRSIVLLQFSI